jgi:exodeoxyribonuclease VII small subunit
MTATKINYQKLSNELDDILERLQSSGVDIDEAIKLYERGQKIVKELRSYLKTAENKITKVKSEPK